VQTRLQRYAKLHTVRILFSKNQSTSGAFALHPFLQVQSFRLRLGQSVFSLFVLLLTSGFLLAPVAARSVWAFGRAVPPLGGGRDPGGAVGLVVLLLLLLVLLSLNTLVQVSTRRRRRKTHGLSVHQESLSLV